MTDLNLDATHRCKVCGCLWRHNDDGTWSWVLARGAPQVLGRCCDNVAMGDQIEALEAPTASEESE